MRNDGPICPACDRPFAARPIDGVPRWVCDTEDCPVVYMESPDYSNPRLGPAPVTPRRPAEMPMFSGRRP